MELQEKNNMKKLITIICIALAACSTPKECCGQVDLKKYFKFSTFYASVNGSNSISDVEVFSVTDGLHMKTKHKHFTMVLRTLGQTVLI